MKINLKKDSEDTANNNIIKEVNDFVYFGNKITANGDSTIDIQCRINNCQLSNMRNLRVTIHQDPNLNQDIHNKHNWSPPTWF